MNTTTQQVRYRFTATHNTGVLPDMVAVVGTEVTGNKADGRCAMVDFPLPERIGGGTCPQLVPLSVLVTV